MNTRTILIGGFIGLWGCTTDPATSTRFVDLSLSSHEKWRITSGRCELVSVSDAAFVPRVYSELHSIAFTSEDSCIVEPGFFFIKSIPSELGILPWELHGKRTAYELFADSFLLFNPVQKRWMHFDIQKHPENVIVIGGSECPNGSLNAVVESTAPFQNSTEHASIDSLVVLIDNQVNAIFYVLRITRSHISRARYKVDQLGRNRVLESLPYNNEDFNALLNGLRSTELLAATECSTLAICPDDVNCGIRIELYTKDKLVDEYSIDRKCMDTKAELALIDFVYAFDAVSNASN